MFHVQSYHWYDKKLEEERNYARSRFNFTVIYLGATTSSVARKLYTCTCTCTQHPM